MISKMLYYIFYKLLNLFFIILDTIKIFPLVRISHRFNNRAIKDFYFDFSHPTTHMGDRLFFMPLFISLSDAGYSVSINPNDKYTNSIYFLLTGKYLSYCYKPGLNTVAVFPAPSYYTFRNIHSNAIIINFLDFNCSRVISLELINSFSKLLNNNLKNSISFLNFNHYLNNSFFTNILPDRCFLFSNYIDSGRFRKFFLNEDKLIAKVLDLKKQGFHIVHVGTKLDMLSDNKVYPFVDIDLRGRTSLQELISLVKNNKVFGAVSYDNFIMHLIGIYGKYSFVLFRGRFSRKNYSHHISHVNNNFFCNEDTLFYL